MTIPIWQRKIQSQTEGIANEILMHFRNLKKTSGEVYINDPIDMDKEGNTLTMMDIVADDENIIDSIDLKLRSEQLHKHIEGALDEREQTIIKLRYGLGGRRPMTQREVASKLHISRSYVSRIEKKALLILRKKMEQ